MKKIINNILSAIFSISIQVLIILLIVSLLSNTALDSINNDKSKTIEELYQITTKMIDNVDIDSLNEQNNNSLLKNYQIIGNTTLDNINCTIFNNELRNEAKNIHIQYLEEGVNISSDDIFTEIIKQSQNSTDTTIYDIHSNCKNNSNYDILEYFKPKLKADITEQLKSSESELKQSLEAQIQKLNSQINDSNYLQFILNYKILMGLIAINLFLLYLTKGYKKTNMSIGLNVLLTGILFIIFNKIFASGNFISKFSKNNFMTNEIMNNITNLTLYKEIISKSQTISIFLIAIGIILIIISLLTKKDTK